MYLYTLCNLVHYVPILSQRILVSALCTALLHYYGALIGLRCHRFACCDLIGHTSDGARYGRSIEEPGCWDPGKGS